MKFKKSKPVSKTPLQFPTLKTGPPPASLEQSHKMIAKLAREAEAQGIEDIPAHLQKLLASGALNRAINVEPEGPAEQAQDLAYRAMEERNSAKARKLVEKALALDPDCVDARVIYAQTRKLDEDDYIAELREAVAAGARAIGEEEFREAKGHFWGLIETRPYMRARNELAMALRDAQLFREAVQELEEMLELCPNDNLGVRDYLLGLYLGLEDTEGAARLMRQYEDDSSAVFAWSSVFLLLLRGQRAEARLALEEAIENNPWVIAALLAGPDTKGPGMWGMGDQEEGEHAASTLLPAVMKNPDTAVWVAKEALQLIEQQRTPLTSKSRAKRGARKPN